MDVKSSKFQVKNSEFNSYFSEANNKIEVLNKKEWIEFYRKNINNYKFEERNLHANFISQDFHVSKIYSNLKQEEETENRIICESIKAIKTQINDTKSFYSGEKVLKNNEIRSKITKLEESLIKIRIDFKNKFENMINEEDEIENELIQLQANFENDFKTNSNTDSKKLVDDSEVKVVQNNYLNNNSKSLSNDKLENQKQNLFDQIIEQIIDDKKYFNLIFDKEHWIKMVSLFDNLSDIKEKITFIENKIVEIGGPMQGWSAKDHQEFLKLKSKYNDKINSLDFLSDLENALPYLERRELKIHINLYSKYSKFFEIKKLFIEKYKNIKENIDNQNKNKILEKVENENNKIVHQRISEGNKNIEKKQQVLEWKRIKEEKIMKEQQEKLEKERILREKEKQFFNEISEKNRSIIESYQKEKEALRLEKELLESKTIEPKKIAKIDLERIKEKNQYLEEKRKLIIQSKSVGKFRSQENYMKYIIKNKEKFSKVESKLDVKTTAIIQKQRNKHDYKENKDGFTMANNVLGRLSRAVPEWRKGLNS